MSGEGPLVTTGGGPRRLLLPGGPPAASEVRNDKGQSNETDCKEKEEGEGAQETGGSAKPEFPPHSASTSRPMSRPPQRPQPKGQHAPRRDC